MEQHGSKTVADPGKTVPKAKKLVADSNGSILNADPGKTVTKGHIVDYDCPSGETVTTASETVTSKGICPILGPRKVLDTTVRASVPIINHAPVEKTNGTVTPSSVAPVTPVVAPVVQKVTQVAPQVASVVAPGNTIDVPAVPPVQKTVRFVDSVPRSPKFANANSNQTVRIGGPERPGILKAPPRSPYPLRSKSSIPEGSSTPAFKPVGEPITRSGIGFLTDDSVIDIPHGYTVVEPTAFAVFAPYDAPDLSNCEEPPNDEGTMVQELLRHFHVDHVLEGPIIPLPPAKDIPLPKTLKQAMASPFAKSWAEATVKEWMSIVGNDTWTLVDKAPWIKVIPCKWVYTVKTKHDGSIDRFKARWGPMRNHGYKKATPET